MMGKEKIAITLDEEFIGELDRLVKRHIFQSRSQDSREAVSEKLLRLKRSRFLAMNCNYRPHLKIRRRTSDTCES
jgi:metal-responsive CopG/Arc/MetJ family transcriptional regulator